MKLPFHARTVTSRPGRRRHPTTAKVSHHSGTDMAVPEFTPIRLDYPGKVVAIRTRPDVGLQLTVQIAPKTVVKLNHLAEVLVGPKAAFAAGDRLALTGRSGAGALGAHLCLELWHNGRAVDDPEAFEVPA